MTRTSFVASCLVITLAGVAVSCSGGEGDAGGVVEGTVSIEGEQPEGVAIELHEMSDSADETDVAAIEEAEPVAETETDAEGAYNLDGVDDGEYTMIADIGDIEAASSCIVLYTVEVAEESTVTADVEVPEGWVPRGPIDLLLDGGLLACG